MSQSDNTLEAMLEASRTALQTGMRNEAVAIAKRATQSFPGDIDALRALADALTQHNSYLYNPALRAELVADGSLDDAIKVLGSITRLESSNYEDFLKIGNCLTAMGDYATAAKNIRHATDLHLQSVRPSTASRITSSSETLRPSFFIIGSAKCGTTSLFRYIVSHPDVLPPIVKEIDYFLHPERGQEWYLSHFPRKPHGDTVYLTGEASVSNISLLSAPELLLNTNPAARLIALARNPVDRAISHYYNERHWGKDKRSLEAAIDDELEILGSGDINSGREYWKSQLGYLWLGLYSDDLERWLSVFPREQLLIVITEEMQRDPATTVESVFRHLGLPAHELPKFNRHLEGVYDNQDQENVRRRLNQFFDSHNERFFELIGRRLEWSRPSAGTRSYPPVAAASRARILSNQGRWSEAAAEWRSCSSDVSAHPDRQAWLESRSQALFRAGDLEQAEESIAELVHDYPESPVGLAGLAQIARSKGDPRVAAGHYEECLRQFPNHPDKRHWLLSLGPALLEIKAWERAAAVFRKITSTYPEEGAGFAGLARVAQEQADDRLAAELWRSCLSSFPAHPDRRWWLAHYAHVLTRSGALEHADSIIRELIADFPESASGLTCLAHLEKRKSNPQQAAALWEECLRRFPSHPDRRWWLLSLGETLIEMSEYKRATPIYEEITSAYPDESRGLSGLAQATQGQGDKVRAAKLWYDCLLRFPDSPDRWWWLTTCANIMIDIGELQQAEALSDEILIELPQEAAGLSFLARLEMQKSNHAKAAEVWAECVRRFPSHPDRAWWLPAYGKVLLALQLHESAEAVFRQATLEYPDEAKGWAGLARSVGLQARNAQAAELWESCIRQFPSHPERRWWRPTYGHLLLDMQATQQGEAVFQRMWEEFPDDPAGIAGLARAAQQRSDWLMAFRLWEDCLSRFPAHPSRNEWSSMHLEASSKLQSGAR